MKCRCKFLFLSENPPLSNMDAYAQPLLIYTDRYKARITYIPNESCSNM